MEASRNELTGRWSLTGVEPSEVTFERMCKMLREGENFKFARYGDGEFYCMAGKPGHNCDGHEYFHDLGAALREAFYSDPKYMVGIQPLSVHGGLYQKAIAEKPGPKNIYDADVLHSASIDGRLGEFLNALRARETVIVGPKHLSNLFNWSIRIKEVNCWLEYQEVNDIITKTRRQFQYPVYLLCASMMSEVIIENFKEYDITIIDCGSVFDPLVNVKSRKYHHKLKLNGH